MNKIVKTQLSSFSGPHKNNLDTFQRLYLPEVNIVGWVETVGNINNGSCKEVNYANITGKHCIKTT